MTVFTTVSKQRLNWPAPVTDDSEDAGEDFFFKIADNFYLDIGDGHKLIIQPANAPIFWQKISKNKLSNTPPARTQTITYIDIGDGFNLLISDNHKLIIGTAERNETSWTRITKSR